MNGGRPSSNEFLIDGAPASTRGRFNFSPPVDAVGEFRVQTNTYDAQYGRTGGGVVNMSLKTGTNELHGQVWEFMRRGEWDANATINKAVDPPRDRPYHSYNQWGGTVTGPIVKSRTFFAATYEGLRERVPFPLQTSVPTSAERRGDFSRGYADQPTPLVIYDPLTTRVENGRLVRDPFPGNVIPASRINPIALQILALYPMPTDADKRLDNFVNPENLGRYDYHSEVLRVDHQINPRSKAFLTLYHNLRHEYRSNNALQGSMANQGQWPQTRHNVGGTLDGVRTLGAGSVINVRLGFTRFTESFYQSDVHAFDRSQLGFGNLPGKLLPRIDLEQYPGLGVGSEGKGTVDNTASVQANFTKAFPRHTLKLGAEYRNIRSNPSTTGNANGLFGFTRAFTRGDPNNADRVSGNSIASFLLGYPASGNVGAARSQALEWHYPVLFVQDDVRLTRRLTLNLGLRWDYESPVTERYDRMVRGFAFDQTSPLAASAKDAAGAAECPACADLKGGLRFAGVGGVSRGLFKPDWNNVQPRAGFAFAIDSKTVLRGGYGLYFLSTGQLGIQTGFFIDTPYFASDVSGRVGQPELGLNTFSSPFPRGLAVAPGADAGLLTQAGRDISFDDPDRVIPSIQQWNLGAQRRLGTDLVVEVAYAGSYSKQLPLAKNINAVPAEAFAVGATVLQRQVANPFAGLLPDTGRNAATLQRQELLRPYPQFANVTENSLSVGKTWFKSLQVRVEKRFSKGLQFLSAYTLSRGEQENDFLNSQDAQPVHELTSRDRTHRWVLSGRYELPFGRGRRFANAARGLVQQLVGGWQVQWIYTMQSGLPLGAPDLIPLASAKLDHPTRERWLNTCYLDRTGTTQRCLADETPVWQQRQAFTLRVMPNRFSDIRVPQKAYQMDASFFKEFRLRKARLQYRLEAFNLFNSAFWYAPVTDFTSVNFGRITNQGSRNFPRQIQMSLKTYF
jgi:hypothetical protein